MVEWKEIKFKQLVAEMGDGGTPDTTDPENFGVGIPWAVVEDVKPEIYETQQQLTDRGFTRCSAKKWPASSIILTTGATIGNVGIAKIELCTKQGITGIVPNEHADNLFLRYWLENNTNQLLRYAQGTTFKEIRTRPLGNLRIKVPVPFTEESVKIQKKISSILYSLDRSIGQTEEFISKTERLKKALMQNLLTGKMKPDGSFRNKKSFHHTLIGEIPLEWKIIKAKDICALVTDGTHSTPLPSGSGFPLVTSKNLTSEGINLSLSYLISAKDYEEVNRRSRVDQYDILYGMIGTIGNPQIVFYAEVNFAIKNVGLLKTNKDLRLAKWILNYLESSLYNNYLLRQQAGTTQQFISLGFLRKLPIPFPYSNNKIDWEEVDNINEKLDKIIRVINYRKKKIKCLHNLKKSLMQNLLTGKVRVKN